MKKLTSILFCLCMLFVLGSFAQNQNTEPSKTEKKVNKSNSKFEFPNLFRPVKRWVKRAVGIRRGPIYCPPPASVESLTLDKDEIFVNCPKASCTDQTVKVSAKGFDAENDVLIYGYRVSAGNIIGEGENVVWDLSGVAPGTYTITAGVDDGCGFCGVTKTLQVTILECPDCKPPDTQVNNFKGVPPGFVTSTDPTSWMSSGGLTRRKKRQNEVPNLPPNVTNLVLNRTEITAGCGASIFVCRDQRSTIEISTEAVDAENDVLTYEYTVSGGTIIGQGAKVIWDLSGLKPGTYTITTGANDGCGICGATKTMTVTVVKCPDCK